jgi:hypothetical protein
VSTADAAAKRSRQCRFQYGPLITVTTAANAMALLILSSARSDRRGTTNDVIYRLVDDDGPDDRTYAARDDDHGQVPWSL